eukprot:6991240-Prymnesium_polylepis.1
MWRRCLDDGRPLLDAFGRTLENQISRVLGLKARGNPPARPHARRARAMWRRATATMPMPCPRATPSTCC